jgi:hypothetical protein
MENTNPHDAETPFSKNIEQARLREKMHEEILAELNNSPQIKELKLKYSLPSVENFIAYYAAEKFRILNWGPQHAQWHEEEDLIWMEKANECIKEIQHKKLFDLQCMWRAEMLDLEGIELCMDFTFWESDILNCPLVPPVTEEEVDLYIGYLLSNNCDIDDWGFTRWQDYDQIKEAYNNDDADVDFPEWYDFYNGRMGTGVYMLYPDTRGESETYYVRLYHQHQYKKLVKEKAKRKQLAENQQQLPPLLLADKEQLRWFVTTFEDKETLELAEFANAFRSLDDYNWEWNNDKQLLYDASENVPVLPHYDWREALHRSANLYRRMKISEALPLAHQSYLLRIHSGIPFEHERSHRDFEEWKSHMRNKLKDQIKQGKLLNGELPDDY